MLQGDNPGTRFVASQAAVKAKKHWLKHTLKSSGALLLDNGAVRALTQKGASLLPSGIVEITGRFAAGESVDIIAKESGQAIAKGICQYGDRDLAKLAGVNSEQIEQLLGYCPSKVVVHRDDMVLVDK